jgi:hypothetical protein
MLRFGTLERLALSLKFEGACCSGLSRSTSASVSSVAWHRLEVYQVGQRLKQIQDDGPLLNLERRDKQVDPETRPTEMTLIP